MKPLIFKRWLLVLLSATMFTACHKKNCDDLVQKDITVTAFDKIVTAETFKIDIVKGTGYSLQAKGCSNDLADLDVSVNNGRALIIRYKKFEKNRSAVELNITMPELLILDAGGTTHVQIDGMTGQPNYMRFVLSGTARCTVNGTTSDIIVDLSGDSRLTLAGTATDLVSGALAGTSTLHAYDLPAKQVDISADGVSKAYVMPLNQLLAEAGGASIIYYKGDPAKVNKITSGTAKIIRQ